VNEEGVDMALKYLSALILPGLLVLFFTRVTYSRIIALVLTVALIAASVYKGYTDSYWLIVIDAFSLTAGFWYAQVMKNKMKNTDS
jgi:general stress protein CsbA